MRTPPPVVSFCCCRSSFFFAASSPILDNVLQLQHQPSSSRSSVLAGREEIFHSHASSSLRLKSELHPASGAWLIMPVPEDCTFAIMCLGQEKGLLLAHGDGEVYLTPNSCKLSSYSGILRSNVMATQFLAIQKVHGCISVTLAARCSCRKLS